MTSSPHFASSNGFIESQVKTVKKTLKKAQTTNSDPYIALMCLRSTPIDGKLPSPAELLFGRSIQDNLPRRMQRSRNNEDVADRLEYRQEQQRHYHDRSCKPLSNLVPGQPIRIQDPVSSHWKPATIKEKLDIPRSYTVTTSSGSELRRNRKHIMEAPPTPKGETLQAPKQPESSPAEYNESSKSQTLTRSGRLVKPPNRYGFSEQ